CAVCADLARRRTNTSLLLRLSQRSAAACIKAGQIYKPRTHRSNRPHRADPDIQRLLSFPEADIDRALRRANLPNSYTSNNGGSSPMSMWLRHKAKVAGRGTQTQRPRPQEEGIWAKPGWK